MKENNSIVRLFRSRKGFLLGSFLFCSMYSIGYALAVHSKELVDSLSILLMSFSLVLFLVSMVEYFYLGKSSTREFYRTLPINYRTIALFRIVSDWLAFTGAYVLYYGILRVRLLTQSNETVVIIRSLFLKMYLLLLLIYLFQQIVMSNCKNPLLGLGITAVMWFFSVVYANLHDVVYADRYWPAAFLVLAVFVMLLFASLQNIREESSGLFYHKTFRLLVIAVIWYPLCVMAFVVIDSCTGAQVNSDVSGIVQHVCWMLLTTATYIADTTMLSKRGGM